MKIENTELKESNAGDPVTYIPPHANGSVAHKDSERGRIKSWNDTFVFVTYESGTKATKSSMLVWG